MGKISQILDELKLNRWELEDLIREAQERLKAARPVYLKEVFKRCGKPGCTCTYGDVSEYGHGPYLYAVWSENGKQAQKSLGPKFEDEQIQEIRNQPKPQWYDFRVDQKKIDRMSQERQWEVRERTLEHEEFLAYYGVNPWEDTLNRPRSFKYDRRAYRDALEDWQSSREIALSRFSLYGVGTKRGVSILQGLEEKGCYIITS